MKTAATVDVRDVKCAYIQNRWRYESFSGHLVQAYCKDLKGCQSLSEYVDRLNEFGFKTIEIGINVAANCSSYDMLKLINNTFISDFFFTVHHPKDNYIFILAAYKETE